MSEKIEITISGVKSLLNEGKSRKEIALHYGVPMSVMKEKVWSHPDLKNLKAKKGHNVVLIDDTVENSSVTEKVTQEITPDTASTEELLSETQDTPVLDEADVPVMPEPETPQTPTMGDWK